MAKTLRELRDDAGLSQAQLARLAVLNQSTVSRLERGQIPAPGYPVLMALAIALKATPDIIADSVRQAIVEAA